MSHRVLFAIVGAAGLIVTALAMAAEPATTRPGSPIATEDPIVAKRELLVAHDLMRSQRVTATDASQLQLLFPDQSSLTLARGAEISIDEFRYDSGARSGNLAATVRTGMVRYVGGMIAEDRGVAFASPGGVVSLRGGIVMIKAQNDSRGLWTEAILLSGGHMCLSAKGQSQCTSKINTAIASRQGEAPSAPITVATETIERWFGCLEGFAAGCQLQRADAVR